MIVSDIAIFVRKRDVKLQLTDCNICMPQAISDVISSIGIGIVSVQLQPIVSGIGRQHGIGLTLFDTIDVRL